MTIMRPMRLLAAMLFLTVVFCAAALRAQSPKPPEPPADPLAGDATTEDWVAALTEKARRSVVVITTRTRDDQRLGLGAGFVVAADGIIATNLHVIGEARPISVETSDGRTLAVTAIHASDRNLDLAVLRVNAKDLPALPLGDARELRQGQDIIALGNPHGLQHSVVRGVVSARREIEGRNLIQLAIPVEAGNSGGPVLDREGRVHGVMTLKSAVSENLGFAVEINALRPLLEKPNSIPIERWLTIGALDPRQWKPLLGAHWRQRAGRIRVEGPGKGFGGRSLCLSQAKTPPLPFEVAVAVRLADEAGAAGLVFASDGSDRHFGFYPSGGMLRLTRFSGPDVFSWEVLREVPSEHYLQGEWNALKVRLDKGNIVCSVNGHVVIEWSGDAALAGAVGLAKFRDTVAQFKQFRVGEKLSDSAIPAARLAEINAALDRAIKSDWNDSAREELAKIAGEDVAAETTVLRRRARELEEQAARLRTLAGEAHERRVFAEFAKAIAGAEESIDLVHAALLVAWLDNEELDVAAYRAEVDRMAGEISSPLGKQATEAEKLAALNRYLFAENGSHGSRAEYYHRSNSYLNEVIDDREGLPITLSVLYIEIGRRIGLRIEGVGLPSHFVVRLAPDEGEPTLIDVFDGGKKLTREDAATLVRTNAGVPLADEHLRTVGKRAILLRMLHNLLALAQRDKDGPAMLRYLDAMIPCATTDGANLRAMRAILRWQAGRPAQAREDVDWLLEHRPEHIDLEQVEALKRQLESAK
jgi:regulator of sirC expression with transglutaminase-like and TPR domain/S1-C subfamily serine protease